MVNDYKKVCKREIIRLGDNARLILNKNKISNEDIDDLNDIYNELDYYNYYKNYKTFKSRLLEDYDYEQIV